MRKFLDQKFWSLGTNLGDPRALGATPVVLVCVRMLILFTFVMIYMMAHPIALENFFAKELASVPMCSLLLRLSSTLWCKPSLASSTCF